MQTAAAGIHAPAPQNIHLTGLSGSHDALVQAACFVLSPTHQLIVAADREEASYLRDDLEVLTGQTAFLFPMSYKRPYESDEIENANVLQRTEVLHKLGQGGAPVIVVTYPEALAERVVSKRQLASNTLSIKKGKALDLTELEKFLLASHFESTDFVYEPGQFTIRGGIVDIFSYAHDLPIRIEMAVNEVERLCLFDPETQLSVSDLTHANIAPDFHVNRVATEMQPFLRMFPQDTKLWFRDYQLVLDIIEKSHLRAEERQRQLQKKSGNAAITLDPKLLYETSSSFESDAKSFTRIEFGGRSILGGATFEFSSSAQPRFSKNFNLLAEDLHRHQHDGYTLFIASDIPKQVERLEEIFEELDPAIAFKPLAFALRNGFIDHHTKSLCYTDHQIFERFHRYRTRERFSKAKALTLRDLQALVPGDYVVHIDYGIGKFAGLDKRMVNDREQESVRLVYKDDDILYLSVHSLHKISKYAGKEGAPPINKLGSAEWESKKTRIKKKVKEIAKDLIALYAKRKQAPGFAYSQDSYLQAELESSFIYEDTPDQTRATDDVKKDMEAPHPMDRLVCGDVGFGKTEVAIRALFKAVQDGKQVAVLVPTTILAMQHFRTFNERLKDFPITIEFLSRFKSTAETKRIVEETRSGKINVVIGTHRLVGRDVAFKDLGLLIVDEEQKFGVRVKERLKEMRINVDVLTLSATPIPRTLHFSLMGARDMSVIATPPLNRQPVTTTLHTFDPVILRDAIRFEISRGGQVYFVHNRVHDIDGVANIVHKLVPDAAIGIVHGQMDGHHLEKAMIKFVNGEHDVLVSTNIIESGLDIPNANTIIINQAHMFGLSDLHQMRGRVGRSNKKAYCYLLTPPSSQLSADARKRLSAFEEFSDLGDGFKVAMRDLDIRGAGNLLGAEQSGFINDLGFETYHRILDDTVQELKETDFKELFADSMMARVRSLVQDCVIETDLEILIPETYVGQSSERLQLYAKLDDLKNEEDLSAFIRDMEDRFGPMPEQIHGLVDSVRLRWIAENLGFEKLVLKSDRLKAHFVKGKPEYFESPNFEAVLEFVKTHTRSCRLSDQNGRQLLIADHITGVGQALRLFEQIQTERSSREIISR